MTTTTLASTDAVAVSGWLAGIGAASILFGAAWHVLTTRRQRRRDNSGATVTLLHSQRDASPAAWRRAADASLARSRRRRGLEP